MCVRSLLISSAHDCISQHHATVHSEDGDDDDRMSRTHVPLHEDPFVNYVDAPSGISEN